MATSDSLSFSWNYIPCESQRYAYSLIIGDDVIVGDVTDDIMVTLPGLIPCTEYTFELRAVNDIGDGPLLVRMVSTLTVGMYKKTSRTKSRFTYTKKGGPSQKNLKNGKKYHSFQNHAFKVQHASYRAPA